MAVKILSTETDITDKVINISKNNASIGTIQGILAESRGYTIQDDDGEINFVANGLLALNNYRDQDLSETNVDGAAIFRGLIHKVAESRTDLNGFIASIDARSPIATVLDWVTESNDPNLFDGFTVKTGVPEGNNKVNIQNGLGVITIPSQVSFSDSLIPRYNIIDQNDMGGNSIQITLDRGVQDALVVGDELIITVPIIKSGPQELFDGLVALNAVASIDILSRMGSSFAQLAAEDDANNHKLFIHVRREDGIPFRDHMAMILKVADLGITVNEEGILDIFRGLEYKGNEITDRLTADEFLVPYDIVEDAKELVIGYDCLYCKPDKNSMALASATVSQDIIDQYKNRRRWIPLPLERMSDSVFDYKIIYANAETADFFGQRHLDYHSAPRITVKGKIIQHLIDKPLKRILPQLGKEYFLSFSSSRNQKFVNEPSRVIGFSYNKELQIFDGIDLQLTNNPWPNLATNKTVPTLPKITNLIGIVSGFSFVAGFYSGQLRVKIFYEDKAFELENSPLNAIPDVLSNFMSNRLNPEQTYFAQFHSEANGLRSKSSEFIKFIPS